MKTKYWRFWKLRIRTLKNLSQIPSRNRFHFHGEKGGGRKRRRKRRRRSIIVERKFASFTVGIRRGIISLRQSGQIFDEEQGRGGGGGRGAFNEKEHRCRTNGAFKLSRAFNSTEPTVIRGSLSPYSSCPDHLNFYGWQFRSELSRELTPPHLVYSSRWTFILGEPARLAERKSSFMPSPLLPTADDATRPDTTFFIRLFPSCYQCGGIALARCAWLKNRFERGKEGKLVMG